MKEYPEGLWWIVGCVALYIWGNYMGARTSSFEYIVFGLIGGWALCQWINSDKEKENGN